MIDIPKPIIGEQLDLYYTVMFTIITDNFNSLIMVDRPRRDRLDMFPPTKHHVTQLI